MYISLVFLDLIVECGPSLNWQLNYCIAKNLYIYLFIINFFLLYVNIGKYHKLHLIASMGKKLATKMIDVFAIHRICLFFGLDNELNN